MGFMESDLESTANLFQVTSDKLRKSKLVDR